MKNQETFLLVSIFGTSTRIVKEGPIGIIQAEKKKLSKETQWKKFTFQVRSIPGFAAVKILTDKK